MNLVVKSFEDEINNPAVLKTFSEYLMDDEASARRMIQTARTEFYKNPALQDCDIHSVMECIKKTVQLGLSLDSTLGHVALIPRYSGANNPRKCQFMPMYKGYLYLGYKYGSVTFVDAYLVRKGEPFKYNIIDGEPKIVHEPILNSTEEIIAAYMVIKFKSGEKRIALIDAVEIQKSKDASETKPYKNSKGEMVQPPWVKYPEEMCKKTIIRKAFKLINICPEIASLVTLDELQEAGVDQKLVEAPIYDGDFETVKPEPEAPEPPKPEAPERPTTLEDHKDFIAEARGQDPASKERELLIERTSSLAAALNLDPVQFSSRLQEKYQKKALMFLNEDELHEVFNKLNATFKAKQKGK